MARQISVSNEVYSMLSKMKGTRSFSETIKDCVGRKTKAKDIMKFAGILKNKSKELDELNKKIAADRRKNYGRKFDW
jgi:predicted CopG family antitoxin